MILKQPAFTWVPTNLTEPWESYQTYQLLHDLVKILKKQKRFLGMLIAGLFALAGIAASSMVQTVQTSQFVQQVKENVITKTLSIQKIIDSQFQIELLALKSTVLWMGDKIHSLEQRISLQCHYNFPQICVTPVPKKSETPIIKDIPVSLTNGHRHQGGEGMSWGCGGEWGIRTHM